MPIHRYRYRLTLEPVSAGEPQAPAGRVAFEFETHDDVLALLARARPDDPLSEADRRELIVGLGLFGGVLLRNRALPMFRALQPHFGAFMKALKGRGADAEESGHG